MKNKSDKSIKKLKEYIDIYLEGKQVKGLRKISPESIWECIYVYNNIVNGRCSEFINADVKMVLDKCGIEAVSEGIGWKVLGNSLEKI